MNRIERLLEDIADEMYAITSDMDLVNSEDVGLDRRCGRLYVGKDGIVVRNESRRRLDYYGGFEYVAPECVHELAGYTFYSRNDDRVDDAIKFYLEEVTEDTGDEDEI